MLRGRESLRRVIGKRRKLIPNLPNPPNDTGFVSCPVCSSHIPGDDRSVNSHLDLCLATATGTKRKLSQSTLLHFSFSSRSKSKTCADDINTGDDAFQTGPSSQRATFATNQLSNDDVHCQMARVHDTNAYISSSTYGSVEKNYIEDNVNNNNTPLSHGPESPNFDMVGESSVLSGTTLETYVVGRKFGDGVEAISGASITLLRDPSNIKDPNAIKVICADSDSSGVLGFLPRELAQYLSPLIDKFNLRFEGSITSSPKNSCDVVPIEIMCVERLSYEEVGKDDLLALKSLCENVVHSINSGKKSPPTIAKYQQNFRLVVEEALKSNLHLFTDDETFFLESFGSLSDDGQRLFVRLYTRKGPWFRISNLSYPEILDYQQAVNELSEASYVRLFSNGIDVDDNDLKEILSILTVSELCDIWRILKKDSNNGMRKKDLIELLHSLYKDGLCPLLPSLILDRTRTCIQISSIAESLLWRVQRLFFLNGEQDLSAFLLVDLGRVKYPEYKCTVSDPVFSGRSDLLAYEEAIEVAQIMDQALDEDNSELILQCIGVAESQLSTNFGVTYQSLPLVPVVTFLQCCSATWVYSKVVLLGVSYLEQDRRYQNAIKLLKLLLDSFSSDGRRGYWTLRLSIDLEHVGCLEESLSVAENGVLDPWVRAGSKMALQRRVLRLGKPPRRWRTPSYASSVKRKIHEVHVQGRPLSSKVGMKSRFYGEDGEQCGVEELALQFYAGEGGFWHGVHTESGIWLTIYGLLMWDIIFADITNVFRSKFQNAPLDMDSDNFYIARTSLIESHLHKIREGMAETILILSWESHLGTVCRGVNWERHSLSELRAAVTCIGGPCLANMCRLLAQDYRSWSSGMPDLLIWRFHGDYSGEAKLVEVKGPRDRLSEQQRAWLLTLMDCGFGVEVCKVCPPSLST